MKPDHIIWTIAFDYKLKIIIRIPHASKKYPHCQFRLKLTIETAMVPFMVKIEPLSVNAIVADIATDDVRFTRI